MDIFSTPFLLSAALAVLLVGIIFTYISYKISEQDHKFSSMIGLISTMAQEVNFLRNKIANQGQPDDVKKHTTLIQVSDDEEEEDEEDDNDDEDDDDDDEEEDDEEDDDDDEEEDDDDQEDDTKTVKVLNITNSFANMLDLHNSAIKDDSRSVYNHDDAHDNDNDSNDDGSLSSHESFFLKNSSPPTLEISSISQDSDVFKNIQISPDEPDELNYKKWTVEKLRKIVSDKKLAEDPSKLKKNELVKLLEDK